MCDDRCAMHVTLLNGRVSDITGIKGHPWNNGKLCVKGKSARDLVYAPDRILKPLKRTGKTWEEIPLETALDEIADRMAVIAKHFGPRSLAVWKGEGVGFQQQESLVRRFAHAIGTPNYLSSDSACFSSRYIGFSLLYGSLLVPDYENSSCITLWGSNPLNTHPFAFEKIAQAKRSGATIIVIDPRKSESAKLADLHAAIKPASDGALAWGIIRCLIEMDWIDRKFIDGYTIGFEEVRSYALDFSSERVTEETGLAWEKVEEIAGYLARGKPGVIFYVGNGLELHDNGTENIRAIALIPALLGCIDTRGGNRLAEKTPLRDLTLYHKKPLEHLEPIGADRFPILYDKRKECHTMTAIGAMLSGKPYPIKGMVLTAGNPLLSNPNSDKVRQAFQSLDLLVVRDLFMTQTARAAHYFLPAASFMERSELHIHENYNIINATEKALEIPGCQDEYTFWRSLARRLKADRYFSWNSETDLDRWLLEDSGIALEEIIENPPGLIYQPVRYEKWKTAPFETESGKIELASNYMQRMGYRRLPEYQRPSYLSLRSQAFPLVMISGSKRKVYNHSRYHNIEALRSKDPFPFVGIHKDDAGQLGIVSGDCVSVISRFSSITLQAEVLEDEGILPGFVLIPDGWEGCNVNLLTSDTRFDPVSGFPSLKSEPVRVEKV